jgi:hypothetical protein
VVDKRANGSKTFSVAAAIDLAEEEDGAAVVAVAEEAADDNRGQELSSIFFTKLTIQTQISARIKSKYAEGHRILDLNARSQYQGFRSRCIRT